MDRRRYVPRTKRAQDLSFPPPPNEQQESASKVHTALQALSNADPATLDVDPKGFRFCTAHCGEHSLMITVAGVLCKVTLIDLREV